MKAYFENYLKNYKILTDSDINLILSKTELVDFKKGSQIAVKNNCFFVLKGCVREFFVKNDDEKTTAFYLEGDSIISTPNQKNEKYYQCLENCFLTKSNSKLEKEICNLIPSLQSVILDEVEKIAHKVKEDLALFISSTPEERYQNLIENESSLLQRVSQHYIASYIGIRPESLSRLRKRIKSNL